MPGIIYGWPKNVLHFAGIEPSILDINATVRPAFAIVDGIVGMEALANAVCCGESGGGNPAICAVSPAPSSMSGTGFVVSADGYVVTNNHVVAGKKEITTVIDGEKRSLTLLKTDAANDLALLKLSPAPPQGIAFREGPLIRPGETVVALGYPLLGVLANEPNVTTGTVSALSGPENDSRLLQFTAPIQQGNSGGPLLDDCGNAIGMTSLRSVTSLKNASSSGARPGRASEVLTDSK